MHLLKVTMSNFLSVGEEAAVPLDLPGLVLLSGNNLDADKADSNGSGKSSTIAGITYAAWGQCPNGLKADEVVHNKVNKNCKVVLDLQDDDGTPIQIIRTRKDSTSAKSNDLFLYVDGVDLSCSTMDETQVKIDAILGLDFHTFCAMMPGCGVKVATMTDKDVKTLLEKVLRTEELSLAHKIANEKYKAVDKELTEVTTSFNERKSALAQSRVRLMTYEQKRDSFEIQKTRDLEEAQLLIDKTTKEAEAKVLSLVGFGPVTDASELSSSLITAKETLTTANKDVTELEDKIQKTDKDFHKLEAGLTTEAKLLKTSLDNFSRLSTCPTCFSEIGDEHSLKITTEITDKQTALTAKREKLGVNYTKLKTVYEEKLKSAQRVSLTASTELTTLQDSSRDLSSRQREYALLKAAASSATEAKEQAVTAHKRIKAQENSFFQLCTDEASGIKELESNIAELQGQILDKTKTSKMLKFWVDSFSPSGIRSFMLQNVTPYLNERASYYCDLLTAGEMSVVFNTKTSQKSGKVAEKFQIEVSQAHGSDTWKGSSGGEKARADLVISLALADLASLRSSKKLKWRAVDEALDPIDKAGDEAVIELLSQMQNTADSIYLISHKDSLKNKIKTEIVMAKKDGFSYLQEIITERDVH